MQDIAKGFGPEATAYTMPDVALGGSSMNGMGFEPKAIGVVFGLKDNETYGPAVGENGVFMIKTLSINPAAEISDYTMSKTQLQSSASARNEYGITETIKESKGIKDLRYKFF
jgi:peptidyl-prolyl cis-trans isomerase D